MMRVQMGDLAWSLASKQYHLEGCAEMGPESDNLGIAQHPLTALGVVPLNAGTRVHRDDVLPHGPTENRPRRSESLVRQNWRGDGSNGCLDIRSLDTGDVQ